MPPTYQDVEQVIRGVTGVASASIGAVGGTGRGRLRIRLEAGHDPDAVSLAVARTLRERFGIDVDPAAIRPRPAEEDDVDAPLDDEPGAASEATSVARPSAEPTATGAVVAPEGSDAIVTGTAANGANGSHPLPPMPPRADPIADDASPSEPPAPEPEAEAPIATSVPEPQPVVDSPAARGAVVGFTRPLIQALSVGAEGLEVHVQAVLSMDDRELRGRATGAATRKATLRAVARATLDAVEQLFPGRVKTELESLELSHDGEDELCTTAVTFLTDEGAEKLIGISMVRGDAEHAVMRATLDAVNRRIGLMIEEAMAS